MTRFAKRTVRSARRYPLVALLCVLVLVGAGWAVSVAWRVAAPGADDHAEFGAGELDEQHLGDVHVLGLDGVGVHVQPVHMLA